jgi:Tfp pilus assembly protein PilO
VKLDILRKWKYPRIDILAVAGMILVAVTCYLLWIQPVLCRNAQEAALNSQIERQEARAARIADRTQEFRTSLAKTQAALKTSSVQLEPAGSVNARIRKLTDLAGRFELKVDEVQPSEPSYRHEYGLVPIRLGGVGNYPSWALFLHELARTCPDISVDSFDLSAKTGAPASVAQFRLNLMWYVSPAPSLAQTR